MEYTYNNEHEFEPFIPHNIPKENLSIKNITYKITTELEAFKLIFTDELF